MMHIYLILRNPGHSRVYFNQSQQLSLAELKIASQYFEGAVENIQPVEIAGVEYISFETTAALTEKEIKTISRLSFVYALFESVRDGKKQLFSPVQVNPDNYLDDKLSSILKYSGKTNEVFTRMMINVAVLSSDYRDEPVIEMLDPVAGKGTTLFEGLVSGFNVSGIEISKSAVHDACVFFKKNLELERYKHAFTTNKMFGNDKELSASVNRFEFARDKDEYKNKDTRKQLTFVLGNSIYADRYFKKDSFDVIVGDLPYGVAHGNVTQKKGASLTRNPTEFLSACLQAWHRVLKMNGVIVLAFNSFVVTRVDLNGLLQEHGFSVFTESPYDEFEHRVDRSIKRDIIVAKKMNASVNAGK